MAPDNQFKPEESKIFKGWYEIPGYGRHLANKKGEIFTKKTKNYTKGGNAGSYLKVKVYPDEAEVPRLEYVHILVCLAFHGRTEGPMVVMHGNNNKKDNRPENLKWGSQSENIKQVYRDGLRYNKESFYLSADW